MKKIAAITPLDADPGFRLAGIDHYVAGEEDAERTLRKVTGEPDTGLVVIEEALVKNIPDDTLKEIEQSWPGILVVLPSPERPGHETEDYALRLIRRAIGYHVRLRI